VSIRFFNCLRGWKKVRNDFSDLKTEIKKGGEFLEGNLTFPLPFPTT
jgi:hypothetical protein